MQLVIVGMGNTLLSDDGVGIAVANRLNFQYLNDPSVTVLETSWGGLRIVDLISGYDIAIIIDASQTGQNPVGTVVEFQLSDLVHSLRMISFHDVNVATAIALAERAGIPMPKKVHIFTVEVAETYLIGESLSPQVNSAIKPCVDKINHLVATLSPRVLAGD